jgi:AcrR family transcriptional regulator
MNRIKVVIKETPMQTEFGTSQSIGRKAEIYQKALDLFVKNGYDGTSMSMVSETLGMSKGNLYHYFSSKEDLLYEIQLDFLQKHFIPILEEAEKVPDPADRIAFFLRQVTLLNTSSKANRVLVHEVQRLDKSHQSEIARIWRRGYELVSNSIKKLQQSGRAPQLRVSFLTFMWLSMPFWVVYWFDYSRQSNGSELAETFVQIFLSSLIPKTPHSDEGAKRNPLVPR